MTDLKIIDMVNLTYHRNGVSGKGFYSTIISWEEKYDNTKEICENMLVTFETDSDDKEINTETCRVVSLDSPLESWRGDNIADALQKFFNESKAKNIYDYMLEM